MWVWGFLWAIRLAQIAQCHAWVVGTFYVHIDAGSCLCCLPDWMRHLSGCWTSLALQISARAVVWRLQHLLWVRYSSSKYVEHHWYIIWLKFYSDLQSPISLKCISYSHVPLHHPWWILAMVGYAPDQHPQEHCQGMRSFPQLGVWELHGCVSVIFATIGWGMCP